VPFSVGYSGIVIRERIADLLMYKCIWLGERFFYLAKSRSTGQYSQKNQAGSI
jgi:hypothetical protein